MSKRGGITEEELETNLKMLSERLSKESYRASSVRRQYIPKSDGRKRPIGVPTLEDKIVQRATVEVLFNKHCIFSGFGRNDLLRTGR